MRRRYFTIAVYAICLIFIGSGAFNYGFTRWYPAVPFMLVALGIARRSRSRRRLTGTFVFCVAAIFVNATLEYNPLVFPVLDGGTVTVVTAGYWQRFPGGAYFSNEKPDVPGQAVPEPVPANSTFDVTNIVSRSQEFDTEIDIGTTGGHFIYYDVATAAHGYVTNRPVYSMFFTHLGDLMYYPALFFMFSAPGR